MFVRNLLQAGDYVTVVPEGVRITLQYNERGSLECVHVGHKDDKVIHPELLTPIIQSKEVPVHLPITRGTTFVYGCLYTNEVHKVEGQLNKSVESHYLSEYIRDPTKYHFFAGHVESYAVGMNAPLAINKWLSTMGFNTLPNYLVPSNLTEDKFSSMLHLESYPFVYPRIMGYILFRKGKFEFLSTNLRQVVVKSVDKYTSYDGYILADIHSHDLGSLNVSFSEVVNFNIHEGSVLLINEDNNIIYCYNKDKVNSVPRKITCEYCGKLIDVPKSNRRFQCSNSHCLSIMFNRLNKMLNTLGLDSVDLDTLKEFSKINNYVISCADVFDLDQFSDLNLSVDAPKLLSAVVPSVVIPRFSDWTVFCNKCNNSLESIKYYISNPDKMMFDLNLDGSVYRRLFDWLQDSDNVLDVIGVLDHEKIHVVSTGKRFEGAPIFRGKSIYLTGKFQHGSFEDVRAILASYSAEVYDRFNTAVDCVIIGGFHEGVSGTAINRAKQMNIPIFEESDFFSKYDIDSDIVSSSM